MMPEIFGCFFQTRWYSNHPSISFLNLGFGSFRMERICVKPNQWLFLFLHHCLSVIDNGLLDPVSFPVFLNIQRVPLRFENFFLLSILPIFPIFRSFNFWLLILFLIIKMILFCMPTVSFWLLRAWFLALQSRMSSRWIVVGFRRSFCLLLQSFYHHHEWLARDLPFLLDWSSRQSVEESRIAPDFMGKPDLVCRTKILFPYKINYWISRLKMAPKYLSSRNPELRGNFFQNFTSTINPYWYLVITITECIQQIIISWSFLDLSRVESLGGGHGVIDQKQGDEDEQGQLDDVLDIGLVGQFRGILFILLFGLVLVPGTLEFTGLVVDSHGGLAHWDIDRLFSVGRGF